MRDRLAVALAAAAVAVIVLGWTPVGKAAYDAVLPRNSVGAAQLKRDAVVQAKVRDGSLLARDVSPGALITGPEGEKGDAGVPGPKGPTGDRGERGRRLWARVDENGRVGEGASGVVENVREGPGRYYLTFDRSIERCAVIATPHSSVAHIYVTRVPGQPARAYISTRVWQTNAFVDVFFNVAVFC